LYTNRASIGGFQNDWYWSSSEDGSYGAWVFYFLYGYAIDYGKEFDLYVRAVRAF
jgi:hypothetical protein